MAKAALCEQSCHIHAQAKDGMSDHALQARDVRLRRLGTRDARAHAWHHDEVGSDEETERQDHRRKERRLSQPFDAPKTDKKQAVDDADDVMHDPADRVLSWN